MKKLFSFLLALSTLAGHAQTTSTTDEGLLGFDSVVVTQDTSHIWLIVVDTTLGGRFYMPLLFDVGNTSTVVGTLPQTTVAPPTYYAAVASPGYEVRQVTISYSTKNGSKIQIVLSKHIQYLTAAKQPWPKTYYLLGIPLNH